MRVLKILSIVGARPQFIKAAPVSKAFSKDSKINEVIVHTGQHFDEEMSQVFFDELKIPKPSYNLNVSGGSHGQMTGRMLEAVEIVMQKEMPELVLVYGDTNSTLAGALAASKLHIPICHIESGLRSYNRLMPEEINRVVTDHLSALLFCPTEQSIENLKHEGLNRGVHHVGDVMFDATLQIKPLIAKNTRIFDRFSLQGKDYGLATLHRAENTETYQKLHQTIAYVEEESVKLGIKTIFPVHPRTRQLLQANPVAFKNLIICDPIGYLDMQSLLSKAKVLITDSGGLQKEAYFHSIPCITMRNETEWVETIHAGWNRLWTTPDYQNRQEIRDYGDGKTSFKIAELIKEFFR